MEIVQSGLHCIGKRSVSMHFIEFEEVPTKYRFVFHRQCRFENQKGGNIEKPNASSFAASVFSLSSSSNSK